MSNMDKYEIYHTEKDALTTFCSRLSLSVRRLTEVEEDPAFNRFLVSSTLSGYDMWFQSDNYGRSDPNDHSVHYITFKYEDKVAVVRWGHNKGDVYDIEVFPVRRQNNSCPEE